MTDNRHASPSPGMHRVDTLFYPAPVSRKPSAPCFRCGARGECKHRQLAKATTLEREIAGQVLSRHRAEEALVLALVEAEARK